MPRCITGTEIFRASCETEDGFVDIKCKIENLKAEKSDLTKAKNAEIQKPIYHAWGYWIKIIGHQKGKLEDEVYIPCIVKLPYEIVPSDCNYKIEDGFIHVFLKKKDTDQSWDYVIRNTNLETASKSEIEEFMKAKEETPSA